MTPVAVCLTPHRKKAQEYIILFFDRFEASKLTTDVMCLKGLSVIWICLS